MPSVQESYTDELYRELKFFACWLPNTPLAVGDVGTLGARRFERVTSLDELEIAYGCGETGVPADLSYLSAGKVEMSANVGVGVGGVGDGKLSISFGDSGATFLQAARCRWRSLSDLPSVERELRVLRAAKIWRPEWVLVHKVLHTGPAAILVSSSAGTTVDLRVAPDVLAGPLPVANAHAAVAASNQTGLAFRMGVRSGATPFFGAVQMYKPLVGQARLRFRSISGELDGHGQLSELREVDWADFTAER